MYFCSVSCHLSSLISNFIYLDPLVDFFTCNWLPREQKCKLRVILGHRPEWAQHHFHLFCCCKKPQVSWDWTEGDIDLILGGRKGMCILGWEELVAIFTDNPSSLSLCFLFVITVAIFIRLKIQCDNAYKMCTNHDSNHYYCYCYFIPIRMEVVQAHS